MNPPSSLLTEISSIPWFENVGKPFQDDAGRPVRGFKDWGGPERDEAEQPGLDLQAIHDEIAQRSPAVLATWKACLDAAIAHIGPRTPGFDAAQDAWHAPTAAVWHAAWVVSLYVLLKEAGLPIPAPVLDQLEWFRRGRWPSAYSKNRSEGQRRDYLIL